MTRHADADPGRPRNARARRAGLRRHAGRSAAAAEGGRHERVRDRAIVPVRAVHEAKTRLAGVLSPADRAALVRSMLERVLDALRDAAGVDRILIVTSERGPGAAAMSRPCSTAATAERRGRTGADARARRNRVARHRRRRRRARSDDRTKSNDWLRPCMRTTSSSCRTTAHRAPTRSACACPRAIAPHSAPAVARAHVQAARNARCDVVILSRLPGLARDVDLPGDLGRLRAAESQRGARACRSTATSPALMDRAAELTLQGFGRRVSYSRKVFIPLTQLCRDVCHYCTFAGPPRKGARAYLTPDAGARRSRAPAPARAAMKRCSRSATSPSCASRRRARSWPDLGFATTLDYLEHCARLVFEQTGLLPHLNAGSMTAGQFERLRRVSASMGTMLEIERGAPGAKGGPHHRSPDKHPAARLATLRAAGEARVPYTTGLLVGIGETRRERDRVAARDPRPARAPRPHPGNHRPEFPGQAGHAHGAPPGAAARRTALDDRRHAPRVRPGACRSRRRPT